MNAFDDRIARASGSPYAVGFRFGSRMGASLGDNIDTYIRLGPGKHRNIDPERLHDGALPWMRTLPERFQQEIEGLANGSGISLQRLAEWCYAEECQPGGCSAFMLELNSRTWVARNNDIWAPELWGYAAVRAIDGRIPTINLGMEAEPFTSTGINQAQVWLHYNYLPENDRPTGQKRVLPPYVLLTEMLETCTSLSEIEAALQKTERTSGMMLFALDGKNQDYAIYECNCCEYNKRRAKQGWIAGTNHACACETGHGSSSSFTRYNRLTTMIGDLLANAGNIVAPADLMHILADPNVEQRGADSGTVFAAVASPTDKQLWFTFGGYPAASHGNWQNVPWPWE